MGEEDISEIIIDMYDISSNKVELIEIKKTLRDLAIAEDVISFSQFLKDVRENFWGPRISNSLTLDLFAVYLNAQKILYIESKTHCEELLNKIMLPAIFISLSASVISLGMKASEYGSLIVASLSAFDAFLLAIISYTKLDAKAEAHKTSSYRFDKLQTKCEFYSGKVLLLETEKTKKEVTQEVSDFIETIEKQIDDIKDSNQFVIPEKIRYRYPQTYSINIFSQVKLLRNTEKLYYNKLHTIYNKLQKENRPEKIDTLQKDKDHTIIHMIRLYNDYANLNQFINAEINQYIAEQEESRQWRTCCYKRKKPQPMKDLEKETKDAEKDSEKETKDSEKETKDSNEKEKYNIWKSNHTPADFMLRSTISPVKNTLTHQKSGIFSNVLYSMLGRKS